MGGEYAVLKFWLRRHWEKKDQAAASAVQEFENPIATHLPTDKLQMGTAPRSLGDAIRVGIGDEERKFHFKHSSAQERKFHFKHSSAQERILSSARRIMAPEPHVTSTHHHGHRDSLEDDLETPVCPMRHITRNASQIRDPELKQDDVNDVVWV